MTHDELAQRDRDVHVLEVVLARAPDHQLDAVAGAALGRRLDAARAAEILAGERLRVRLDVADIALGDDVAAMLARARPHVDDVVGGAHRVLVMLDDDQRVAQVAQAHQRLDQARVVALVQADARLVEDVEHAHQARADLRRQADALRLAAGERVRRAVEREVVQADVDEEAEPRLDLLENLPRDDLVALAQRARRRSDHADRSAAGSARSSSRPRRSARLSDRRLRPCASH